MRRFISFFKVFVFFLIPALLFSASAGKTASASAGKTASSSAGKTVRVHGKVLDEQTGLVIPSRIYIRSESGKWFFPVSESPEGSAIYYKKKNWNNPRSIEMHTTLSAHPFLVDLVPGRYMVTVERGKEFFPLLKEIVLKDSARGSSVDYEFKLKRWINMAELGWYSGDTHVHRTMEELPNVMRAENLNVAFPILYWVHSAFVPPGRGKQSARFKVKPEVVPVDSTHVIYPMNTEYEIFNINGKNHSLGAFFVLNHRTVFKVGVPPLYPIALQAKKEGGLIELDKHAWPWSMALVPILGVDLYELANNHMWRTEFGFWNFGEKPADYMKIETDKRGFTQWGWINYTLENYYALLDCGFRLRPTAGTASGVHPVPLGFGRVYVYTGDNFSYANWINGLNLGRSFVTTGPMLFAKVNGRKPGYVFKQKKRSSTMYNLEISTVSPDPLTGIEIIVNGMIHKKIKPENQETGRGSYKNMIVQKLQIKSSSWIAVRCFELTGQKRIRFAHTGPFYIDVQGSKLVPRSVEIEFLIHRVEKEIERSKKILPPKALKEYKEALQFYKEILVEI